MDFEFLTDVTGQPLARCDMESEYFGDWLSHDIGSDKALITSLLHNLDRLLGRQIPDYEFVGKIYHLTIADEEVDLFLNNNDIADSQFEDEQPDGPVAGCGLVELKHLLASWQAFIA
ncbi:YacL family protein [Alteromonas confluentis]|uniref:Uncharacterized protein n=1 Tax=Alteromonas confluentis TaxID=1656094 RepID=A0A1E7Z7A7_9ALTE|nr:YacL family protein [Alteromonas confluentis]OFC69274.1 hypothetical protein BFC18_20400 [Alteromonas confluentis]